MPLDLREQAGAAARAARRRAARAADARRPRGRLRRASRASRARARGGASASVLVVGLALVPVGVAIAAQARPTQGLRGSISSRWKRSPTRTPARRPTAPSRLTAAGSVRARYWDEALRIFGDNPLHGRRRRRLRDGAQALPHGRPGVRHAHGYVVQTLADLGIAGLAGQPRAARRVARERRGARPACGGAIACASFTPERDRPADARRRSCSSSACTRSSTGRGSCPPTPPSRCSPPAGSPAAGRSRAAPPRRAHGRARASACAPGCASAPRAICGGAGRRSSRSSRRGRRGSRCAPTRSARTRSSRSSSGDVDAAREQAQRGARPQSAVRRPAVRARARSRSRPATARFRRGAALQEAVRLQPANPEPWIQLADVRAASRPAEGR